ncbi:CHASE2 domain-containing protein [Pseudanabaena sp. PCC 6802]|uniref:CHASE2 domain-containing protein n=1 Tax=Pseudanabaena sp. PCC 6802 TaxID=118173 RepID=UPI00034BA5AC|nr:CHASE2 domain-containing protein [Pseudanabaena sp. PCC 6802]
MILRKAWQRTALWLGIGWSLLWSVVLSDLPLIQQLDLGLQDRQVAMGHPSTPPPEILLVTIGEADLKAWPSDREPTIYADLVQRLLDSGASVVALNLLPNWVQTSDHANNPIKALVKQHASQIVIVLPTSSAGNPSPSEWRNYEYFLPLNAKGESLFPPRSILGFSEYEPEAKHPLSSNSTARQAYLSGQFTLARHLDRTETLDSVALLSLKKFQQQDTPTDYLPSPSDPIRIHFWGTTGTFPSLRAGSVLRSNAPLPQVRHKIVLVGFSDTSNPEAFAIRAPLGDTMPAIEVQANLLGSLLTRSFYRTAPLWLQGIFVVLGGIVISKWIVWGNLNPRASRNYQYWLFPLVLLGSFALLGTGMFWTRLLIPFVLPLTIWIATGLSVLVSLQLGIQKDLIDEQQCEIERLHRVEQAAVISQTQKLLHRIAANIHEGPLQELKLVMDRLEILQMNFPQVSVDPILEGLESLGHHLRQQLNQTKAIALEITPELREGLDAGIKNRVQQLVQSGELTLQVIQEIQPLEEPTLNSQWLEAREDIYSFFGEAVKNVVRHAQPPHGTATQVKVSLSQQGTRCTLTVENDGAKLDDSVFARSEGLGRRGGYGMKLMSAIAADLPEGAIERVALPEGGMRVALSWTLQLDR